MNDPWLLHELESLLLQVDYAAHRANDPVELVHGYGTKQDQELVALLASCLAYGRVALVRDAGRRAVAPLGAAPAEALRSMSLEDLQQGYRGFVYRMTRGEDLVDLLWGVRAMYQRWPTLDAAYAAMPGAEHLERASAWVRCIRQGRARSGEPPARGLKYLLPDPADGSASKRLHLFFRWMARGPDGVDLGCWEHLKPEDLVMPLDTHTARICRYIGLSGRRSADGKMALEVTKALQELDPKDPLRFDFALCHLGISKGCIHRRSQAHCPTCPLQAICTLS